MGDELLPLTACPDPERSKGEGFVPHPQSPFPSHGSTLIRIFLNATQSPWSWSAMWPLAAFA